MTISRSRDATAPAASRRWSLGAPTSGRCVTWCLQRGLRAAGLTAPQGSPLALVSHPQRLKLRWLDQGRQAHAERLGDLEQRRNARVGGALLDVYQHAAAHPRSLRQLVERPAPRLPLPVRLPLAEQLGSGPDGPWLSLRIGPVSSPESRSMILSPWKARHRRFRRADQALFLCDGARRSCCRPGAPARRRPRSRVEPDAIG